LRVLHEAPRRPGELFRQCGNMEDARFMGDWSFWSIIAEMTSGPDPLIDLGGHVPPSSPAAPDSAFFDVALRLTAVGEDVIVGRRNAIDVIGIDRWVGGTHLTRERYWTFGERGLAGPRVAP
ncbi:MAG: hypothetical protein R3178_08020, partial [Rhodothermales bacterium]|nr:hypothetical protein [Rhodothermales bacterium]